MFKRPQLTHGSTSVSQQYRLAPFFAPPCSSSWTSLKLFLPDDRFSLKMHQIQLQARWGAHILPSNVHPSYALFPMLHNRDINAESPQHHCRSVKSLHHWTSVRVTYIAAACMAPWHYSLTARPGRLVMSTGARFAEIRLKRAWVVKRQRLTWQTENVLTALKQSNSLQNKNVKYTHTTSEFVDFFYFWNAHRRSWCFNADI